MRIADYIETTFSVTVQKCVAIFYLKILFISMFRAPKTFLVGLFSGMRQKGWNFYIPILHIASWAISLHWPSFPCSSSRSSQYKNYSCKRLAKVMDSFFRVSRVSAYEGFCCTCNFGFASLNSSAGFKMAPGMQNAQA